MRLKRTLTGEPPGTQSLRYTPRRRILLPMRWLTMILAVCVLGGCGAPSPTSFDVTLRNQASDALTVGFVKKGGSLEREWASPEDLTNLPPSRQPTSWGVVIGKGKTANVHMTGQFERGSVALIRIYLGDYPMNDLLAMSRGSGERLDVALEPGHNNAFLITSPGGKLSARLIPREPQP